VTFCKLSAALGLLGVRFLFQRGLLEERRAFFAKGVVAKKVKWGRGPPPLATR